MNISIPLTKEEKKMAKDYAKCHSLSLENAFKDALFEKIEDEYLAALANDTYKEHLASGKTTKSILELFKECNL